MNQVFKTKRSKTMFSYFLLAAAIIGAYKIITEIHVVFFFINRLFRIISPFIYGFILAYVLSIPCGGIRKLLLKIKHPLMGKINKMLSIVLTYLFLLCIIAFIFRMVIPSVYNSVYLFATDYRTYYQSVEDFMAYINDLNILNIEISMDKIITIIRDFNLEKLPSSINAILAVPSALLSAFLAFVSSIYILHEKDRFKTYLCRVLHAFTPELVYAFIFRHAHDLNHNFKQYIYTQTIDGCILGTIATIELSLLGSKYAVTLGIMLGVVNYIPYFGSIFGSILTVVIVAFTQGLPVALVTAIALLITQQVDGNIIQPKLMGDSFSLSPLLIIISITIGGALTGIWGMLIAIPVIASLKNILEDIVAHYEKRKLTQKENDTD